MFDGGAGRRHGGSARRALLSLRCRRCNCDGKSGFKLKIAQTLRWVGTTAGLAVQGEESHSPYLLSMFIAHGFLSGFVLLCS